MDPQSSTVHQFHHFLCHFTQNYQKNNLGPPSGPTEDPKYDFCPNLFKIKLTYEMLTSYVVYKCSWILVLPGRIIIDCIEVRP